MIGKSFLKPREIEKKLNELKLNKKDLSGFKFNILSNRWALSSDCSVNYILVVEKINFLFRQPMEYGKYLSLRPLIPQFLRSCIPVNIFIFSIIIINILLLLENLYQHFRSFFYKFSYFK